MQTMDDLRKELFATLAAVRKGDCDVATAKAVTDLSQAIINTAKAEADYARATNQAVRSGLIPLATEAPARQTANGTAVTVGNRTTHTLGR